ncbi:MAG: crossover junction endodeoxyribonuclease RuvC, partial [Aeromonadales bacterium]|nr:crossover junction endodeoxyribonuclease RuvC [Aeromonadales bacterium]
TQVQHMVVRLLSLPGTPQEDAADGLAVAICHGHTRQSLVSMAGQARGIVRGRLR